MQFTYEVYQNLIRLLRNQGYCFADYHNYEGKKTLRYSAP